MVQREAMVGPRPAGAPTRLRCGVGPAGRRGGGRAARPRRLRSFSGAPWSTRQRAEAAADLAALAGAQALLRGGDACGAAKRVAAARAGEGGRLRAGGEHLYLVVEVALPGVLGRLDVPPARARARAGEPP